MLKIMIFSAFFLFGGAHTVRAADAVLPLCPGALQSAATNPLLLQALKAAYPSAKEVRGKTRQFAQPCIFPYKAISYEKYVVLITLADVPGEACHGCPARVSAAFLRRDGKLLKPSGVHEAFTEAGSFGSLSEVTPIRFGNEEGLIIGSGGTFQGHTFSVILPFLVRNGLVEAIGPAEGIPFVNANCEARDEGEPCTDVNAEWRVEGRQLIVHYTGKWSDETDVNGSVVYQLDAGTLTLVSGAELAAEMEKSGP